VRRREQLLHRRPGPRPSGRASRRAGRPTRRRATRTPGPQRAPGVRAAVQPRRPWAPRREGLHAQPTA
jgi:hypothetical protein